MRLPGESVEYLLDHWPVARLATLRRDGMPHQVPIVFARHAGRLWSPIDGKPKSERELARVRHLAGDPRAGLLLDDYAEDWTALWWLRLDGRARALRPRGAELDAVAAALRAKYPQYARVPLFQDEPTLIEFRIETRRSWCASGNAAPRP
ncbi:MAG: TIGR03668 family PPOX class F420-dependent oxidoreductase [Proteobacteria bacterium]|nr:TIGR03668 family PPOX class F420-dependent oxidoreductase [Pseudomonadota bacterium]